MRETRKVDVVIKDGDKIVFEKKGFEVPEGWSDNAAQIMASKYAAPHENSAQEIFIRVVNTIRDWGLKYHYFETPEEAEIFADKLYFLLEEQKACFNSPVLFNLGLENHKPMASACYILGIKDDLDDILDHCSREGKIFKWGSGVGVNLSTLRARGEKLSTGGTSTGPLSFFKIWDRSAGQIRSGGTLRRAARMTCLNVDHPDITDFVRCKSAEEEKARLLSDHGIDHTEASATVDYQNTNISVCLSDEFMEAYQKNKDFWAKGVVDKSFNKKVNPRKIMRDIAEQAHKTGDPGIIFTDTVNRYNTVPSRGKITSSNPCFDGETLLHTPKGLKKIKDLSASKKDFKILCYDGRFRAATAFPTGKKELFKITLSSGNVLVVTEDHRILSSRKSMDFVEAREVGKKVELGFKNEEIDIDINSCFDPEFGLLGYLLGDGTPRRYQSHSKTSHLARIYLRKDGDDDKVGSWFKNTYEDWRAPKDKEKNTLSSRTFTEFLDEFPIRPYVSERTIPQNILESSPALLASCLRGLFSANGCVLNNKTNRVSLKTTSKTLAQQVIVGLSSLGIHSYLSTNKKRTAQFENGEYECKESYNVNICKKENLAKFQKCVGFIQPSKTKKLAQVISELNPSKEKYRRPYIKKIEFLGEDYVYDFTEPETHTGVANGVVVHNCGEFFSVNNNSCNLASMNILKYIKSGKVDMLSLEQDVAIMTRAMDILINEAHFPLPEIKETTQATRPLGLGATNIAAALACMHLPYDSSEGRFAVKDILATILFGAFKESVELAKKLGPFSEWENNKEETVAVYKTLLTEGKLSENREDFSLNDIYHQFIEHGIRNSQLTLLAPTGTISFVMDADTTGIEPFFALEATKNLSGGGKMRIKPKIVEEIQNDTTLSERDKESILKTTNEISWRDHLQMVASAQKYLNGGISKTINMSSDATVEDIEKAILHAWNLGVKAFTIYRDGSKINQPLVDRKTTSAKEEKQVKKTSESRIKLPDTRLSWTHKFSIAGHEGYVNVGMYPNGAPGEVFIQMNKQGSTLNGLMDAFAVSISLALQYGVPLQKLVDKFKSTRFEPAGITAEEDIRICTSLIDYIFRWIEVNFITKQRCPTSYLEHEEIEIENEEELLLSTTTEDNEQVVPMIEGQPSGDFCMNCNSEMIRAGTCSYCPSCGETSGCS